MSNFGGQSVSHIFLTKEGTTNFETKYIIYIFEMETTITKILFDAGLTQSSSVREGLELILQNSKSERYRYLKISYSTHTDLELNLVRKNALLIYVLQFEMIWSLSTIKTSPLSPLVFVSLETFALASHFHNLKSSTDPLYTTNPPENQT
jgi:hypothetical protein